jgi:hypothetical protein
MLQKIEFRTSSFRKSIFRKRCDARVERKVLRPSTKILRKIEIKFRTSHFLTISIFLGSSVWAPPKPSARPSRLFLKIDLQRPSPLMRKDARGGRKVSGTKIKMLQKIEIKFRTSHLLTISVFWRIFVSAPKLSANPLASFQK